MKSVLDHTATRLNRRDDKPNVELAIEIIQSGNSEWIQELVTHLQHEDKHLQSDCIKVLYEIGERGSAQMIAPFYKDFGNILKSKNNRLVWGGMIALDTITLLKPNEVFGLLDLIMETIQKGSVITMDHGINILAQLSSIKNLGVKTLPLLMDLLLKCPAKQLPMYAEKSLKAIHSGHPSQLEELIQSRFSELTTASQKKRILKVLTELNKVNPA